MASSRRSIPHPSSPAPSRHCGKPLNIHKFGVCSPKTLRRLGGSVEAAPLFGTRASCRHRAGVGCHFRATPAEYPYEPKPARATDPHGRKTPARGANIFLIYLIEFLFSLLYWQTNPRWLRASFPGEATGTGCFGAGEISGWHFEVAAGRWDLLHRSPPSTPGRGNILRQLE